MTVKEAIVVPRIFSCSCLLYVLAGVLGLTLISFGVWLNFVVFSVIAAVILGCILWIVGYSNQDSRLLWMPAGTLRVGADGRKSVNDRFQCPLVKGGTSCKLSKAEPKVVNVSKEVHGWYITARLWATTPTELKLFYEMAETQHLKDWLNSALDIAKQRGVPDSLQLADWPNAIKTLLMRGCSLEMSANDQLVWNMLQVVIRKACA